MGIYTDRATTTDYVDPAAPRDGLHRGAAQELLGKAYQHDPDVNSAVYGARPALQCLYELNVISGTIPVLNASPTDWVKPDTNGQTRPRAKVIKALALEADVENASTVADAMYDAIEALYPEIRTV